MEAWQDWLRQYIPLKNGIPSHDTIARVFTAIDSKNFQSCFIRWVSCICGSLVGQVVAMDGKAMRGSHRRRSVKNAIHLVSAFASSQGICLGQVKTEEKSNEITAIPELIALLELKGSIVTLDSMGCQTEIAHAIIEKEADYVLALKGNHGNLHDQVLDFLKSPNNLTMKIWERGRMKAVKKGMVVSKRVVS